MIITGWRIDAFGPFCDEVVEGLPPGLVVLYGPNEAGKTSLLRFFRFMLFGATAERPFTVDGQRAKGVLLLRTEEGDWRIRREARGKATIEGPNGPASQERLLALLGGIDARLFRNVFAFGLDELNQFEVLTDVGVRDRIFSAGITGAGLAMRRVRSQLETQRGLILRPRKGGRIETLLEELRAIEQAEQALVERMAGYDAACAEEVHWAVEVEALHQRLMALGQEERELELLLELEPLWREWREAEEELARRTVVHCRPEWRSRLQQLEGEVLRLEAEERALEKEADGLEAERAALQLRPSLEALQPELSLLAETEPELLRRLERLSLARQGLKEQVAKAEDLARRLAVSADSEPTFDPFDPRLEAELTAWEERLRDAEQRLEEARSGQRQAAEVLRFRQEELAACMTDQPQGGALNPEEVKERLRQWEEYVRLRERLAERRLRLLLLLAAALVLAVFGLGLHPPEGPGLLTVAVAFAFGVLATEGRRLAERQRALAAVGKSIGLAAGSSEEAVNAYRRRLEAEADRAEAQRQILQRQEALLEKRQEAERFLRQAEERLRAVAAERAALVADFANWRTARGLPDALNVAELHRHLEGRRALAEARRAVERTAETVAAEEALLEDYRRRALALLGHQEDAAEDISLLLARVRRLAAEAADARRARRRAEELAAKRQEVERRLGEVREELSSLRAEEAAILTAAGVADREAFWRLAADADAYQKKEALVLQQRRSLAQRLGPEPLASRLRTRLETEHPLDWQAKLEECRQQQEACRRERDTAIERRTRVQEERKALEASAELAGLAVRRAALQEELSRAVADFCTYRLAEELLRRATRRYIEERQPEVLHEASAVLRLVTDGRHRAVVPSWESEDLELVVQGGDGRSWDVASLSRGTAEALYLALRLGLARSFAERVQSLPLCLDDVLVNQDPGRAERLLLALRRYLPEGALRQVLLFTCHPETVERVRRLVPGAVVRNLAPTGALTDSSFLELPTDVAD